MPRKKKPVEGRTEDGKFLPGVTGNPKGRPKGSKNHIVQLKQDMEVAIRANVDPAEIRKLVRVMLQKGLDGDTSAAKLILDKFLSNAKVEEDAQDKDGVINVIIRNATPRDFGVTVEGEIIEEESNE